MELHFRYQNLFSIFGCWSLYRSKILTLNEYAWYESCTWDIRLLFKVRLFLFFPWKIRWGICFDFNDFLTNSFFIDGTTILYRNLHGHILHLILHLHLTSLVTTSSCLHAASAASILHIICYVAASWIHCSSVTSIIAAGNITIYHISGLVANKFMSSLFWIDVTNFFLIKLILPMIYTQYLSTNNSLTMVILNSGLRIYMAVTIMYLVVTMNMMLVRWNLVPRVIVIAVGNSLITNMPYYSFQVFFWQNLLWYFIWRCALELHKLRVCSFVCCWLIVPGKSVFLLRRWTLIGDHRCVILFLLHDVVHILLELPKPRAGFRWNRLFRH